jgi:hypothetical protein
LCGRRRLPQDRDRLGDVSCVAGTLVAIAELASEARQRNRILGMSRPDPLEDRANRGDRVVEVAGVAREPRLSEVS